MPRSPIEISAEEYAREPYRALVRAVRSTLYVTVDGQPCVAMMDVFEYRVLLGQLEAYKQLEDGLSVPWDHVQELDDDDRIQDANEERDERDNREWIASHLRRLAEEWELLGRWEAAK